MFRFGLVLILLCGAWVAEAGQIQIGGTNGLTSTYISGNCPISNCLNAPSPGGVAQTSPVAFSEINYNSVLFANATNGGGTTSPIPYAGYSSTVAGAATMTDSTNGVTFSMINDSTSGGLTNNAWSDGAKQSGQPALYIPINVFGVTDVWTMLNVVNGLASPSRDIVVAFDFASTSGATTGLTTAIAKLANSANSTTATGQVRNAIDCSAGCPANNYSAGANGPMLASSNPIAVLDSGTLSATTPNTTITNQITTVTNNLYSFAYSGGGAGTGGNVVLDDQGFIFSGALATTALANYLVDIRIFDSGTTNFSGSALSAVTVNTAATSSTVPEPTTVLTFLVGLGFLGLLRLRRV